MTKINNLDDLKKLLYLQKNITIQAQQEIIQAASDTYLDDEVDPFEQAESFMLEEAKVLEKYANYPTLSEFEQSPSLLGGAKWGATFGVSLIVGELIIEQLKLAHPNLSSVVKNLYILFLKELNNPTHSYLIEPLEKHLNYKVTEKNGKELSAEKQKFYMNNMLGKFTETVVAANEVYGLIEVHYEGVAITPLGRRVLLHLIDASNYIAEVTSAHSKFQNQRPKLSMV